MEKYDPKIIEQKWQKYWEEKNLYKAQDFSSKPKWYTLVEFPYPSGDGLHVGHVRSYTALDVISRKLRMQGYNVLYSIGWDAFGLPTENYAIKNKIHPRIATEQNIATFKRQLKSLGFSYDWSREINTTNPEYYRWTQWIFLKLFEKDLAYKKKLQVNWCPSCKIVLANEEVIDDKCERCGDQVMKKEKEQWILAISKYADRLIEDLKTVDYLEKIKTQQINWIGKSEGAQFVIKIKDIDEKIEVYTTRLDTIFGMTYAVVAPEHPIIERLKDRIDNYTEVEKYIIAAQGKTDLERTELQKEKTGVELKSVNIINPFNQEELPLYVADYVLGFYGTGAVMAVPAHDERDFEFAKKYNLPIKKVIESDKSFIIAIKKSLSNEFYNEVKKFASVTEGSGSWKDLMLIYTEEVDRVFDLAENNFVGKLWYIHSEGKIKKILFHNGGENKRFNWESDNGYKEAYDYGSKIGIAKKQLDWKGCYASFTGDGVLMNSENYSNLSSQEARERLTAWLEKKNIGGKKTNYKLRDWIFSRQHYWGEPIPIIHCKKCGIVPVPEIDLPVELPDVESYEPTDTGESPLAKITDWVNVKCPKCGTKGRRETDTMPNWAGSSWYFLRYIDPNNNKILADLKKLKYWMPVDLYNGGMEHTTLHLLYSRFWNKFLFDIGISPVSEPYARRRSHGMVLAEDGKKMSKSLGNVINPDDVITEFGTDTLRIYEMFMGPFEDAISWSTSSMIGVKRFLEKVYKLQYKIIADNQHPTGVKNLLHKTIKKVTEDIENFRFNTAISQLMILANAMEKEKEIQIADYKLLITILSPFAPHITEELWEKLGNKESIFLQKWPVADEKYLREEEIEMVVQVNGKLRDRIFVAPDVTEDEAKEMALESEKIKSFLDGKEIKKIIFVPKRLINIVIN